MDELILRVLRGEGSEIEERQVRKWRESSSANERQYTLMARLWNLTEAKARSPGASVPAATADIVRAAEVRRAVKRIKGRPGRRLAVWGIAAAAVLAIGVGVTRWRAAIVPPGDFAATEFAAGVGETVTVTLNDGSFVRLAPDSRIRVADGTRERELWLEGRAFFAVARDEDRPFTVHTGAGSATVLGTRFELRADDRNLRLVVVEGRVAVSAGGTLVEVGEREVGEVHDGSPPSVRQVEHLSSLLQWPGGILVFQNTPLSRAAEEISRFFDRPVELTESVPTDRRVTAWFGTETFEEVVQTLCVVADVQCSVTDSLALISAQN